MFPFSRDFYFVSIHQCLSIFKVKNIYPYSKKYFPLRLNIFLLKANYISSSGYINLSFMRNQLSFR